MILNGIGTIIGLAVLITGIYYRIKEKKDKESVKIYRITSAVGGIIFIVMLFKSITEIGG